MNKEEIKEKIEELKGRLIENSTDAELTRDLTEELLHRYDEYRNKPVMVEIPVDDVVNDFRGDTFEMCYTKKEAVYKNNAGYTVICPVAYKALFEYIFDLCNMEEEALKTLDGNDRELLKNDISVSSWVMTVPVLAMQDLKLKYSLYDTYYKYVKDRCVEAVNMPLQEEDAERDDDFRVAVENTDKIK